MVKKKDLKTKNLSELKENLGELRLDLLKSNSQVASGTTPKNPGGIKQTKKTIARIITLMKQKEEKKKHE